MSDYVLELGPAQREDIVGRVLRREVFVGSKSVGELVDYGPEVHVGVAAGNHTYKAWFRRQPRWQGCLFSAGNWLAAVAKFTDYYDELERNRS